MMGYEKKSTQSINAHPDDIAIAKESDEEEQQRYVFAVERGISHYESRFKTTEQIPAHRAVDARNVRLIQQKTFNNIEARREATQAYLKKIYTGFWIIPTGRSRFRNDIEENIRFFDQEAIQEYSVYLISSRESSSEAIAIPKAPSSAMGLKKKEKGKAVESGESPPASPPRFFSQDDSVLVDKRRKRKADFSSRYAKEEGEEKEERFAGTPSYSVKSLPDELTESSYHEEIDALIRFGLHASYTRKEMIARAKGEQPAFRVGSATDIRLSME